MSTHQVLQIAYNKFGRELVTHPSGNTGNGSISLNVVNLQFVLSLNGKRKC